MKPLGTEPASLKSKRLDIATRLLQALTPMAGNNIISDHPDTIHFFVKLAYTYADELLKYEEVDSKDIEGCMPAILKQSNITPGVLHKVKN